MYKLRTFVDNGGIVTMTDIDHYLNQIGKRL